MKKYFIILVVLLLSAFVIFRFFKNNNLNGTSETNSAFRDTNHLILTKHVKCRMDCRHINIDEIKEIINKGEVNYAKSGKGSKGDDTYALEGYSVEHEHLRVVVAPESDGLVVITCIDLDKEWPCNCD